MADEFTVKLRNYRMSARKVRLVADLVRGEHVHVASDLLRVTNRKIAPVIYRMLNAALANMRGTTTVDEQRLIISEIYVNEGVTMRRFMPRARGRASLIRKRMSHIVLKLKEI